MPERIANRLRHMEMHGIRRETVESVLKEEGCRLVDVAKDDAAGPGWISLRYFAQRRQTAGAR